MMVVSGCLVYMYVHSTVMHIEGYRPIKYSNHNLVPRPRAHSQLFNVAHVEKIREPGDEAR